MPAALPAVAAWAAAAWSSAVTVTAVGLTKVGVMAAIGEGATIALAGKMVAAGATMALSAGAAALMRPNTPSSGTTLDFKPDPKAPVRGVMGYAAVGGSKVFQATWGYKKVAMSLGVALSLGPIDQVTQFRADDAVVAFAGPQNEATGFYAADMWQRTTTGLPTDAALLPPTGLKYGNPALTGWGSQHAAPGVSFAFWTMVLAKNPEDRDIFTNGVPDPRWVGRWMKVWDPRKDSTYPGGSGPQRRDDWRTWAWSENPYVHALAWVRGWHKMNADGSLDRSKRIAGIGAPDAAIDMAAFVEGMNVAEANAWAISGEWSTSDSKFQTLVAMLQAGGGEPISRGAQISVMVNAPRVATYTYTRDDLIGAAEVRTSTPRRERKNTIIPRYRSEAHGWEYVPAGEVTSQVYRTEDRGEPRSLEVEYSLVRHAKQAGQLAAYDLANLREGLTATLPSRAHLMHVHPGDCIVVDLPEVALSNQKFLVRRATANHQSATVTLELRAESDAKHAWALGQVANPPPSPSLSAVDPKHVPPPAGEDWTVLPKPPGEGGVSQPVFVIEAPVETADIVAVIIKHGPSAEGPWTDGYEGSPRADGRYEVTGLTPGQSYCVSLQYVAKNGAKSEPSIKCGVVAGDLIAGDTTHLKGEPVQNVLNRLTDAATLADQNRQAVEALEKGYGDTVSAAASAAEAATSEAAATQAKADALIAKGDAQTSATAAATKATEAASSASTALTSKNDAAASATTATTKAQDATNAAASATTQAGLAAGSATAAGGSATAAAGSASTAATKATEAGNSATAANASKVAAESARDTADQKATAAASSASSAATSATAAGTSASAAQTAKTAAETARAAAETAQTSAANSATTATGAASTATTQAGIATTAKNDAQAASSAAVTARNQASSFADAAGVSAGASAASSVTAAAARDGALAAAIDGIPSTVDRAFWSSVDGNGGAPMSLPDASAAWQIVNDPDLGPCWSATSGAGAGGINLTTKGVLVSEPGRKYEITFRGKIVAVSPDGTTNLQVVSARLNGAYNSLGGRLFIANINRSETGVFSFSAVIDCDSPSFAAATFLRPSISANRSDGTPIETRIGPVTIEDVTAREAAKSSAKAAATSASSAAASETAAGQSASAATTAKTAAETARGQAQTAATQASNSRDDAAGSAASASTSAQQSANSRDAAAGSANAAAGSATTAATKAGEAGTHAAAAMASQVSATTASKDALGAAILGMPEVIRADLWATWNRSGKPEDRVSINPNWVDAEGAFIDFNSAGPKQYLKWETGKIIELVSTVHNPNAVNTQFRHNLGRFDAAHGYLNLQDLTPTTTIPAGQTVTVTTRFGMGVAVTGGTNVAQSGAEWLSVAVRNNLTSGNPNRVLNLTVRDMTVSANAEGHASAAATSASSAAASETAAGQSATAASGSATNASTSAGNAQTYMNQASSSASAAAGSASAANTSAINAGTAASTAGSAKDTAVSAAATATSQASSAGASAAAASLSADLAASVNNQSGFNILPNSTFADGFTGWSTSSWNYTTSAPVGPHAYLNTGGTQNLTSDYISINASLSYVLSADFRRLASSGNVVVDLACYGNSGGVLGYSSRAFVNSNTNFGEGARRFVKITSFPAGTTRVRVRVFGENLTGLQTNGAGVRQIKLEVGESMTAWRDDAQFNAVGAQLNITAAVAADTKDRVGSARFSVTGGAGGDPFDISLKAGPDGSDASLTATRVRLRNIVNGQAINVLDVVGGKARFGGDVEIDGNLLLAGTLNGRRVIIPDSVTPLAATYAAGSVGLNGTSATQVQEVWVTTQGGPIVVDFNGLVNMRHDPSGSFDAIMEVRRSPNTGSGIQMLYMSIPALGGGNDSVLGMYPLKLIDRPAAGTWRYFVTVASTTNNMTTQEVRQRFMSALEYRTNS